MRKFLLLIPVAALAVAAWYFYAGGHAAPASQPPLAELTSQSIEALRSDFNRAADEVRVVLLLSPT